MNEAIHCLKVDREVAEKYRSECAVSLADCQARSAHWEAEVERMKIRIREIDAAIKKLGGK